MTQEALKLALEALENAEYGDYDKKELNKAITAIKEALAQPEQDNTYTYASSLATAIWQKHYIKDSPKWKPLDTIDGVLTQIDNMTCGLVREKPAQPEQEPVAWQWLDTAHFRKKLPKDAGDGVWNPLYAAPQRTERPVDCERCNRLEEQAYDLVGKLRVANIKLSMQPQRTWVGLTDEDCEEVERWVEFKEEGSGRIPMQKLARYIEAKLKEKNCL